MSIEDINSAIGDWRASRIDHQGATLEHLKPGAWTGRRLRAEPRHELTLLSHTLLSAREAALRGDGVAAMCAAGIWNCKALHEIAHLSASHPHLLVASVEDLVSAANLRSETPLWFVGGVTSRSLDSGFLGTLDAALQLILHHWSDVADCGEISTLVLMRRRGLFETCNSWTSPVAPGTLYTDYQPDAALFAKDVVHEAAHNWLNHALAALEIELDPTVKYFSPWKGEPRSTYGMIHAGFAFSSVIMFLERLFEDREVSAAAEAICRAHMEENRERLAAARGEIERSISHVGHAPLEAVLRERLEAVT